MMISKTRMSGGATNAALAALEAIQTPDWSGFNVFGAAALLRELQSQDSPDYEACSRLFAVCLNYFLTNGDLRTLQSICGAHENDGYHEWPDGYYDLISLAVGNAEEPINIPAPILSTSATNLLKKLDSAGLIGGIRERGYSHDGRFACTPMSAIPEAAKEDYLKFFEQSKWVLNPDRTCGCADADAIEDLRCGDEIIDDDTIDTAALVADLLAGR